MELDLEAVARGAADDAGGLDPALLGGFLPTCVAAAASGRRLRRAELEECGARGATAAQAGVALRALVDLYLSASWRLWEALDLPDDAVLRGISAWTAVFGHVSFELFGQFENVIDERDALFAVAADRLGRLAGL